MFYTLIAQDSIHKNVEKKIGAYSVFYIEKINSYMAFVIAK